ncbi:MAG TPA: hypothetical protein V6C50_11370, partial [Crinalium sp.]
AQLVHIAEAALRAENDVLVNGNVTEALNRNPAATKAKSVLQNRLQKAQERQLLLAARKDGYINFQTKLTVKKIAISDNQAILEATEQTVLSYDLSNDPPDAPKTTESHTEHRFTFVLHNGEWHLIADNTNSPDSQSGSANKAIPPLPINPSITPSDPLAPSTE